MDLIPYSQEHRIFREAFRRFLEKEIIPHVETWEEDGIVPHWAWKKLGDHGLSVPREYGGVDADFHVRITRILAGSNEIMKQIIARAITKE